MCSFTGNCASETDVSWLQKIKQIKDKKKHKAVIKDKRQKGLLPEKDEESEDEDWEDDEEDEDEDESEDEAEGLLDIEAEESDEDEESDDEEIGGVCLTKKYQSCLCELTDSSSSLRPHQQQHC